MKTKNNVVLETRLTPKISYPVWGIVITAYKRHERLLRCLDCLYGSIRQLRTPTQIVIMDSSPTPDLQTILRSRFKSWSVAAGVHYVHLLGANQSRLRNKGLARLGATRIRYVLFLDSDIYLSKSAMEICSDYLNEHPTVVALAPPLISYREGSYELTRSAFRKTIRGSYPNLIMPSKLDFQLFRPQADAFIESHMLRGAFIIRRDCLKEMFNDHPWHESFEVWQNVDLFLSLREMSKLFGYVLSPRAICLHDERSHPDTIGSWLLQFHEQTIKSLILIFHRNQLWRTEQRILNRRFWDTIRLVVGEHCSSPTDECLKQMLRVAHCLSVSKTEQQGHVELNRFRSRVKVREIKTVIELLLTNSWSDIQSIKSYDLNKPM